MIKTTAFLLLAAAMGGATPAAAQTIVSATAATINSGGPGFGSVNNTFNQAGLLTGYVSGVTNFNTYIAGNPQHSMVFTGNEWFSNQGSTSASVTYDLGQLRTIDALALWNEDQAGIGALALFGSTNGVTFNALGSFIPTDTPNNANYGAQVFGFASTGLRYIRFDMSNCPQQPAGQIACGVGEVAFRAAPANPLPEPATWALLLLGFGAIGFGQRRQRTAARIRFG